TSRKTERRSSSRQFAACFGNPKRLQTQRRPRVSTKSRRSSTGKQKTCLNTRSFREAWRALSDSPSLERRSTSLARVRRCGSPSGNRFALFVGDLRSGLLGNTRAEVAGADRRSRRHETRKRHTVR